MKCTPSHCEHEPCRTCPAHRLVIYFMQLWTLILSFTLSTFVYYLFVNIDFIMHVVHFCILPLCEHWFYHAHYSLLYFTLLRTLIISCTAFTFVFHAVVTTDCIYALMVHLYLKAWFTCILNIDGIVHTVQILSHSIWEHWLLFAYHSLMHFMPLWTLCDCVNHTLHQHGAWFL